MPGNHNSSGENKVILIHDVLKATWDKAHGVFMDRLIAEKPDWNEETPEGLVRYTLVSEMMLRKFLTREFAETTTRGPQTKAILDALIETVPSLEKDKFDEMTRDALRAVWREEETDVEEYPGVEFVPYDPDTM